jgi:hypothetical protein
MFAMFAFSPLMASLAAIASFTAIGIINFPVVKTVLPITVVQNE